MVKFNIEIENYIIYLSSSYFVAKGRGKFKKILKEEVEMTKDVRPEKVNEPEDVHTEFTLLLKAVCNNSSKLRLLKYLADSCIEFEKWDLAIKIYENILEVEDDEKEVLKIKKRLLCIEEKSGRHIKCMKEY